MPSSGYCRCSLSFVGVRRRNQSADLLYRFAKVVHQSQNRTVVVYDHFGLASVEAMLLVAPKAMAPKVEVDGHSSVVLVEEDDRWVVTADCRSSEVACRLSEVVGVEHEIRSMRDIHWSARIAVDVIARHTHRPRVPGVVADATHMWVARE